MRGLGHAKNAPHTAARGGDRRRVRSSAAGTLFATRASAFRPKADGLREPEVHPDLAWAAAKIAGENPFARRRIRIEQAVGCPDYPGLTGLGRNSRTSVKQRRAERIAPGGDVERG